MSNKIVPSIYRAVIDDVISAIKPEFDEYGVGEEVLAELQHKWESKVIASHVAEFEAPHPPPAQQNPHPHPHAHPQHPPHHAYPPHPMHFQSHPHYPPPHNPYAVPTPQHLQQPGTAVKSEPLDHRYILTVPPAYLPQLTGPQLNGSRATSHPGGQQSVISFPNAPPPGTATAHPYTPPTQGPQQAQQQRIPQADGPSSSSSSGSPSPPPSQSQSSYAPHPSHPSLPQASSSVSPTKVADSEAINSDLDDSDTEGEEGEGEEGGAGETDIVFCTYDKVARVKNKWKCILKDGMIHINGRDYLFAKCTGEFEW